MTPDDPTVVVLPPLLDLPGAEPLCRELLARMLAAEPTVLDGSQVTRVSTPSAQVLVAARRSAEARGLSFKLNAPSNVLTEALTDLGIAHLFVSQEG
jgi:chemotaxis protein CheX